MVEYSQDQRAYLIGAESGYWGLTFEDYELFSCWAGKARSSQPFEVQDAIARAQSGEHVDVRDRVSNPPPYVPIGTPDAPAEDVEDPAPEWEVDPVDDWNPPEWDPTGGGGDFEDGSGGGDCGLSCPGGGGGADGTGAGGDTGDGSAGAGSTSNDGTASSAASSVFSALSSPVAGVPLWLLLFVAVALLRD